MNYHQPNAEVFVPDGRPAEEALRRTTHMGVGAHQDDIEILAFHGILQCRYANPPSFTAVVCTDGAGSPRAGGYANTTNEQMQEVRWQEQRNAAAVGRYSAAVQLKHPSSVVKDPRNPRLADDLAELFRVASPRVVYTHNLADKHDTHLGVVARLIDVLRALPAGRRPDKLYGCEVWRNLDWMPDSEKVILDVSKAGHLAATLLGAYDSQIAGGKRYDLATIGRWRSNATYLESHAVDSAEDCIFAADLTPLLENPKIDIIDFMTGFIDRFRDDVVKRLRKQRGN